MDARTPRTTLTIDQLLGEITILEDRIMALEEQNYALKFDSKTKALRGDLSENEIKKIYDFAATNKLSLAVMLLDLDDFKKAQDTRSHQWGDLVLSDTVHLVRAHLRKTDLIFRYGAGDEFLILVVGLSQELVSLVRHRLEQVLADREISAEGFIGQVSATIGMAYATSEPFNSLLGAADADLKVRKTEKKVGR